MAILRSSEPCIFAIFNPTILKFWILIGEYLKTNETFRFFDTLSISSEIELGLGPSQIKFFLNCISSLFKGLSDRFQF
jgi:hypothetical protein